MIPLTIRHVQAVCYCRHGPGSVIEPPHLLLETRRGSEVLDVSVGGISKVDIFVHWMDADVVDRVELSAKVVVKDG